MEVDEFRRVAVLGLGRANLWLRNNPWQPHAETIAHICSHNTAYDAQCEGSRAQYAYDLVSRTDAHEHFTKTAIAALMESKDYWDTHHLYHLARLFAKDGDTAARAAIYDKFARADAEEPVIGAGEIMQLDGTHGLLFVLDRMGQWVDAHPDFCVSGDLLWEATNRLGEGISSIIEHAATENQNIRKYMAAHEKWLRECKANWKPFAYRQWKYSELRQQILEKGKNTPRGWLTGWGHHASENDLHEVAADVLREQDSGLLMAYLDIFSRRDFPPIHERLLELAASEDPDVSTAACRALRRAQHELIHPLVLTLVEGGRTDGDVIRLLAYNYHDTDHLLIESLLKTQTDEDILHWQCHAAVEVFEVNEDAHALAPMLQVYERCRCSICRLAAVKVLVKREKIPAWMLEECQFDSNEDTRELVRQNPSE